MTEGNLKITVAFTLTTTETELERVVVRRGRSREDPGSEPSCSSLCKDFGSKLNKR